MKTVAPEPNPALALFSVEELLTEVMSRRLVSCLISVELDQACDESCKRGETSCLVFVEGDWEALSAHNATLAEAVREYLDEELESDDE